MKCGIEMAEKVGLRGSLELLNLRNTTFYEIGLLV